MATIARLVVEISAKTAEFHRQMDDVARSTRDSQRQMEASSRAVTALAERFTSLRKAFRTGVIGEQEFAGAMRTLQADVHELAQQGNLAEASMDRLAKVGAGAAREIRNVTAIARRGADGFEAFGVASLAATQAAAGGIAGIGSAASTLGVFAVGNPWLIGILAGLSALAAAWNLIRNKAEEAAGVMIRARGMGLEGTRARLRDLGVEAGRLTPFDGKVSQSAVLQEMSGLRTALTILSNDAARSATPHRDAARAVNEHATAYQNLLNAMRGNAATANPLAGITPRGGPVTPDSVAMPNLPTALAAVNLKKSLEPMLEQAKLFRDATLELGGSIASGIVGIAQAAGAGFKSFGAVLLSVLGGLMATVGRSMIAFGVAGLAIKQFVKNPALAIAAGATLVAIGSALSSSAQATVSGSAGAGGFVAAASGGVSDTSDRGGTFIIHGKPRDTMELDDLAALLRELGYRRIEWADA